MKIAVLGKEVFPEDYTLTIRTSKGKSSVEISDDNAAFHIEMNDYDINRLLLTFQAARTIENNAKC